MEKKSKFKHPLREIVTPLNEEFPSKYWNILGEFLNTAETILQKKGLDIEQYREGATSYARLILKYLKTPPEFESYHKALREPIDYYQVGNELFSPMIDFTHSTLTGIENIKEIENSITSKENVILFANHQIEADPQAISLLLQNEFPKLAQDIIFVAGERVITDALAVPLSLGRNLFCIYSKKYFDTHAERKTQMLEHNKKTISIVSQQLKEGGKCIYIAPSGGRDRPNKNGIVEVAPFDPQSIELLYLLGKKSGTPTHYYPLALSTHHILPPPADLQIDLGEARSTEEAPIHIAFGSEINMEKFPESDNADKVKRKLARTAYIENLVRSMYQKFPN